MKYTLLKIFWICFCSIFIVIGCVLILSWFWAGDLDSVGMGVPFVGVGTFVLITQLRQLSRFQKMTYGWYKAEYPALVSQDRVSCFSCGSSRVAVRALMNKTFHREHFCTQCGTALYYSPE